MLSITVTIARSFNVTPFEIMAQDCDEVIMIINYFAQQQTADEPAPTAQEIDREESAAFWSAL